MSGVHVLVLNKTMTTMHGYVSRQILETEGKTLHGMEFLQAIKCPGWVPIGLRNESQGVHVLVVDGGRSMMCVQSNGKQGECVCQ